MCNHIFEKEIFDGKYIVTSVGDIYRIKNGVRKKLHKTITLKGIQVVSLNNGEYSRQYSVGRLVAESFVPNPQNYHYVNYLDNDPTNNDYKNLVWSQKNVPRNIRKTQITEEKELLTKFVESNPYSSMNSNQAAVIKMRIEGKTYAEISNSLNISRQAANQIILKIIGDKAERQAKIKLFREQIDQIKNKISSKSNKILKLQNELDKSNSALRSLTQELNLLETNLNSYYLYSEKKEGNLN